MNKAEEEAGTDSDNDSEKNDTYILQSKKDSLRGLGQLNSSNSTGSPRSGA